MMMGWTGDMQVFPSDQSQDLYKDNIHDVFYEQMTMMIDDNDNNCGFNLLRPLC